MDIDKATPRPWTYDAVNQEIVGANNETVGGLHSAKDDVLAVQAVNAYEPMLEALKAIKADLLACDGESPALDTVRISRSILAAKVTLDLAESKPETAERTE